MLIGIKQDMLIQPSELQTLADTINKAHGKNTAKFRELSSVFGHDAFLKEPELIGTMMREHLEAGLERELADELIHNTDTNSP